FSANTIVQIDPSTNAISATIPIDPGPRFATVGNGSVWVMSQGSGRVTRINSTTGQVDAVIDARAPGQGGDIAFGADHVWVTAFGKPATKIDPKTNRVIAQYVEEGFGDAIRVGFNRLWISGSHVFEIEIP